MIKLDKPILLSGNLSARPSMREHKRSFLTNCLRKVHKEYVSCSFLLKCDCQELVELLVRCKEVCQVKALASDVLLSERLPHLHNLTELHAGMRTTVWLITQSYTSFLPSLFECVSFDVRTLILLRKRCRLLLGVLPYNRLQPEQPSHIHKVQVDFQSFLFVGERSLEDPAWIWSVFCKVLLAR